MLKKKYIIQFETANIRNFDPNFELALNQIKQLKMRHQDQFDFEIVGLFDGFVENCRFNAILNTFLKDIISEDNLFHYIYENDFVWGVQEFLANYWDYLQQKGNDGCAMDAFIWTKHWGKVAQFGSKFYLPNSIMTEEKCENFMMLGPDYIIAHLTPAQIFQYVVPSLYEEMAEADVLHVEEFKNLNNYRMGLH